jgi:hypothetical protein
MQLWGRAGWREFMREFPGWSVDSVKSGIQEFGEKNSVFRNAATNSAPISSSRRRKTKPSSSSSRADASAQIPKEQIQKLITTGKTDLLPEIYFQKRPPILPAVKAGEGQSRLRVPRESAEDEENSGAQSSRRERVI